MLKFDVPHASSSSPGCWRPCLSRVAPMFSVRFLRKRRLRCSILHVISRRSHQACFSLDLVHYLVYCKNMIKLNMHEAKTHLSKYLAKLKAGERILLCNRNHPVAEITALPKLPVQSRPIGLAKGRFSVPASFFEPLPKDLLNAFEGMQG